MALRDPQALLATYTRAGVLCLAPAGRTCIAHGLPEAPDTFYYTPTTGGAATACHVGWFVESWDSTSVVFVNSVNQGLKGYVHIAQVHSVQE